MPAAAASARYFKSPCYQQLSLPKDARRQLGGMRGVPDVSYNADCNNALLDVRGAVAPGYSATPGWDPASGWGTPNLIELPKHMFELLEH